MMPPSSFHRGPLPSHLDPEVQVHLVLFLLLLSQLLVVFLLALGDALPAAADFHHAFLQWQVVQFPIGQQLLGELLVTVPGRWGVEVKGGSGSQSLSPPQPQAQGRLHAPDSHGRLLGFSLEFHLLGGVCSSWRCPHLTQLSLWGKRERSYSSHLLKYSCLLPHYHETLSWL